MNPAPQIVTPTEQGYYLISASVRPHGALLVGHPGFIRAFDRQLTKTVPAIIVNLRTAHWHQRN